MSKKLEFVKKEIKERTFTVEDKGFQFCPACGTSFDYGSSDVETVTEHTQATRNGLIYEATHMNDMKDEQIKERNQL